MSSRPLLGAALLLSLPLAGCVQEDAWQDPCMQEGACRHAWTAAGGIVTFPTPLDEGAVEAALAALGFEGNYSGTPMPPLRLGFSRNASDLGGLEVAHYHVNQRWTGAWDGDRMVFDESTWTLQLTFVRDDSTLNAADWVDDRRGLDERVKDLRPRFEALLDAFEAATGLRHLGEPSFQMVAARMVPVEDPSGPRAAVRTADRAEP